MDSTLQALGGILLRGLPTFLLVILLHFYLKHTFFRPLERVLQSRYDATEGARKLAEASLEKASAKAAEHEAALRAARAEIYHEQEQLRQRTEQQHAAEIQAARASVEASVSEAKLQLSADVEKVKQTLIADSELLANQIADSILRPRVA